MLHSTSVRWIFLASILLSVLLAGCTSTSDNGNRPHAKSVSPTRDLNPVHSTGSPDGGKVRVEEKGISQITDSHGMPMVSLGVAVESTSKKWVAVDTELRITIMNDSGDEIKDTVDNGKYKIYDTFPGRHAALGAQIHVARSGASRIKVDVGTSTWIPQDGNAMYSRITVSSVSTRRNFDSWNAAFKLKLSSAYTRSVTGDDVNIIFRDKTGHVIGGAGGDLTQLCDSVPPGHSTCLTGTSYPLPEGTVDDRTDAYVSGT